VRIDAWLAVPPDVCNHCPVSDVANTEADVNTEPDTAPDTASDTAPDTAQDSTWRRVESPPIADAVTPAVVAVVLGVAASFAAGRDGAELASGHNTALLVVIALAQALVVLRLVLGARQPGWIPAAVVAIAAAAAADVVLLHWQRSDLDPLVGVLGLALPALFATQLFRGTGRTKVTAALAVGVVTTIAAVAPAAYLQLGEDGSKGPGLAAVVLLAAGLALAAGYLTDLIRPTPRFDPAIARGFPGIVVGLVVGAVAAIARASSLDVLDVARAGLLGAAVGLVAGLLSVGSSFVMYSPVDADSPSDHDREVDADHQMDVPPEGRIHAIIVSTTGVAVSMSIVAPVCYLLCHALRG
jgi:hypothetical protein